MIRLERKKFRVRGKAITPPQPKANQVVNRKIDTGNLNLSPEHYHSINQ